MVRTVIPRSSAADTVDTRRQLVLAIDVECRVEGSAGSSAPAGYPPGPSRDGPSLRPWTQHTIDHPSGRHAWRDDVCARCCTVRREARPYRVELPCAVRWIYALADGSWSSTRPRCPGHAIQAGPQARPERGGPGGFSLSHSGSGAEPRRGHADDHDDLSARLDALIDRAREGIEEARDEAHR